LRATVVPQPTAAKPQASRRVEIGEIRCAMIVSPVLVTLASIEAPGLDGIDAGWQRNIEFHRLFSTGDSTARDSPRLEPLEEAP
jgi:hypothetical protein